MTRTAIFILGVLSLLPAPGGLRAQDANTAPTTAPNEPAALLPQVDTANTIADAAVPVAPDTFVIGDSDLLSIYVYEMPDLSRQIRVSSQGTIRLPYISHDIRAAGITSLQLQNQISAELIRSGLARDPAVRVAVIQVESRPIVVAGAVNHPITLQAARPIRLLEAISRAGGLTTLAGDTAVVTHGNSTQTINLSSLMRSHQAEQNVWLIGNDTVTVLPAQMIYVVGNFQKPGAFPLRTGQPIGVLDAISLAEGFKDSPDRGGAEIIHRLADGSHQVQPINVDHILRHTASEPTLRAGDILYVPTDTKRLVLVEALRDAAQLLTLGAAYHFP